MLAIVKRLRRDIPVDSVSFMINFLQAAELHARFADRYASRSSAYSSGRVMSENEVSSFDRLVAGEAGFEQRLIRRFAVFELSEPPAARRSVFS